MIGLMSTACTDQLTPAAIEKENLVPEKEKTMVFQASLEQPEAATKTSLDGLNVVWTEGDKIRIFNHSHQDGVVFTLKAGDGGKTSGSFEGKDIGDGPYYAIYPASVTDGTDPAFYETPSVSIHGEIGPNQSYVANSFGNGANVAVASASDLNLSFKNLFGTISFTLTGDATITKINVYTRGSDILNGYLHITDIDTDNPVGEVAADPSADHLYKTLSCGSGVALNDGDGVTFYIMAPVDAFAKGFFVEFIDDAGTAMIKSAKESSKNVVKRSGIIQMSAFKYTPQYSASFLSETKDFAAYSAVTGSGTKLSADQFASQSVAGDPGSRSVRFQNWTDGYSFSLNIILPINHNQAVAVDVENLLGDVPLAIGSAEESKEMKVIKKFGNRAWVVDAATSVGYVVRLTD